jgi:hypothetical protein
VTQAQAEFAPPGIANPRGATYAHVVWSEDMVVQGMSRQVPGTETGEIAVLKGIQGARGYPF